MSTEVRRHERHTPSGGTTTVRRHARRTGWSPGQFDEVGAAVSAFSFSVISVLIWSLTAVMSVTAAILSVVSALALAVLGHKVHRRRKTRQRHGTPAQQLARDRQARRRRYKKYLRAKRLVHLRHPWNSFRLATRHPGVRLRLATIARLKRMLGRADQVVAGRNDPRRAK